MPNLDEHMAAEAETMAKHPSTTGETPPSFLKKQALFFGLGVVVLIVFGYVLSLAR